MSHGSVEKCEPNMTPMLDLVLQLVMFFMLCANFMAEDVNSSVKLPTALQARPLDKAEDRVIFLNVDKDGKVLASTRIPTPLTNRVQVAGYMRTQQLFEEQLRKAAADKGKPEPPVSLVVIRAHEDCRYEKVAQILLGCREAGFGRIQFRAKVGNSN